MIRLNWLVSKSSFMSYARLTWEKTYMGSDLKMVNQHEAEAVSLS